MYTALFWGALVLTLVLLACSLWTGFRARRSVHLRVAPLTLVALGAAIVFVGVAFVVPRKKRTQATRNAER